MKIDIRELVGGDRFMFLGGQTVFEIINQRGTYKSIATGNVYNVPVFHRMDVISEDWMKNV